MEFPEPVRDLPPDEADPWHFHNRHIKYENAWITVTESAVTRPDGQPGIYGVVHYVNRAVAVVPIDDHGCTWLVGQYRPTVGHYSWEVPEGGVPRGEDLVEGARRELLEETGLTATTFELVSRTNLSNSVTDEEGLVFVATGLSLGAPAPEGTEQLRVLRMRVDDVMALIDRGEITDGFTVIAMAAADRWQKRKVVAPVPSQP